MIRNSRAARAATAALALAAVLAGCSGNDQTLAAEVTSQLPSLEDQGFTTFVCGEGEAIGASFQQPAEGDFAAQCWKASPSGTFLDAANTAQDKVIDATGGINFTSSACPEDAFGAGGGIACRATLVERDGEQVLVRVVAVLADPRAVLGDLPQDPTQAQIEEALAGAKVEILVGTEPLITNPVVPTDS